MAAQGQDDAQHSRRRGIPMGGAEGCVQVRPALNYWPKCLSSELDVHYDYCEGGGVADVSW